MPTTNYEGAWWLKTLFWPVTPYFGLCNLAHIHVMYRVCNCLREYIHFCLYNFISYRIRQRNPSIKRTQTPCALVGEGVATKDDDDDTHARIVIIPSISGKVSCKNYKGRLRRHTRTHCDHTWNFREGELQDLQMKAPWIVNTADFFLVYILSLILYHFIH